MTDRCVLYATRCKCEKFTTSSISDEENGLQNVNTSVKIAQAAKRGCDLELCSLVTGLCPARNYPDSQYWAQALLQAVWIPQEQCPEGLWGLQKCSLSRWPWQGHLTLELSCSHPKDRGLQAANGVSRRDAHA